MRRKATYRLWSLAFAIVAAAAQESPGGGFLAEWRHIGNSALDLGLAGQATGGIARVWYPAGGRALMALTPAGRAFAMTDSGQWASVAASGGAPKMPEAVAPAWPEPGARVRAAPSGAGLLYAFGDQAYRSGDGGATWTNLTAYRGASILGGPISDLAVSPADPDEVTAANGFGVWRSFDGGLSWTGLNRLLPNLPAARILAVPQGASGVTIGLGGNGAATFEWAPGEKSAWRPSAASGLLQREIEWKTALSAAWHVAVTAVAQSGDFVYAGSADGRLWASSDRGRTWRSSGAANEPDPGPVNAIWLDPAEPRVALAALAGHGAHVRRTTNSGLFWDDLTANLPGAPVHGIAADRGSGVVYAASDSGVYYTFADLSGAGPATPWTLIGGLPPAPVTDVRLDAGANRLWVAVEGEGVYSAIAPHRFRDARLVNAADFSQRAAAPGSLLSLLGARVERATSDGASAPVLAATASESQILVPFEASGSALSLVLEGPAGKLTRTLPLQNVSPAIFTDPEGAPLALDADSGVLLDAMRPARSGARIQILATGFGRVKPEWPTGLAAPVENPPRVAVPVRAFLDRQAVEVTRATLAPGYIGFYLIEVQLPRIVNAGPAELYLESENQPTNRVRLYVEP